METGKHAYWLDRFQADSTRLTEVQRIGLINATLTNICGLEPQELVAFTLPQDELAASGLDGMLRYASAERKIDLYFNGGSKVGIHSEDLAESRQRSDTFRQAFKEELEGIYALKDLDEVISVMGPGDEAYVVQLLVGHSHPLWRKIRNAYIPGMTSLINRNYNEDGNFVRGEDVSHTLFDGQKDAVDEIENLILGESNKE